MRGFVEQTRNPATFPVQGRKYNPATSFNAGFASTNPATRFNDDATSYPPLLDIHRRPAPLPLGHAFCEGQGDVARRGFKSRRYSRAETGAEGRPGAVLSRRAGARVL